MNRFLLNGLTSVFVSLGLSGASHAGLGAGGGYSYQGGRRGSSGGAYAGLLAQGSAAALPVGNALSAGWERTPAPRSTADELELANATATKELVIIDAAVPEKHRIYEQRAAGVAFEVLREGESGLAQLTAILSRYRNLEALHIFSHAQDGALYLGDSVVNKEALSQEINTLASMDRAMKDGADVMFYGCNLAQSEKGEALLELVSAAAHVDVAASNDLTGAEGLGGDWDLEIKKGDIKTRPRFDSIAMVDYTSILPFSGTLALGNMPTGYANAKSYTISGTSYTIKVKSGGSGSKDLYNYNTGYVYVSTNTSLQTTTSVYFTGGETFSLSSIYIYQGFGAPTKTIRITSSKGGTQDSSGPVSASSGTTISFSGAQWTDITSFTIQYADSTTMHWVKLDNIALTNLQSGKDSDGTLTASAVVTEPVGLSSTVDTAGEAVNLFDFTLTDGGGGDGLPMTVSQVVLNVTGTSSDTERGNIIWRLNGNDASFVAGSYNGASDTVTFSSLSISVADNSSETYTVSGYYGTPTGLTEDHTIILSVDGDSDLVVGASGTQMASGQSAVTNGSGTTLDITASKLTFSTQPAGSTSGSALTTQPVVAATDIFSNVDVDYASDISLSESSSGVLSGTTTQTPVSGVATFTNVAYTATADQENFALTAAASGLSDGTSSTVTSDVVATQLIFSTQPAPTSIDSGSSTSFTTVPVVQAVDGSSTLDVGYSTDIVLSVTDPNDGVLDGTVNSMSGTGDGDGSGTTVTLTPSSGSATYTNLALQYTNGGATDTIALKATSGGLSSANSSSITSTTNNAPVISNLNGDSVSWAGVGATVNLDSGGDASGSDTELDALNGGNGDYSGGTLTVQRVGGAVTSDLFGFDTSSGAAFSVNGSDLQSSGQTFASFTNANGVLSITFNSSSTAATTALVSDVMSRVTYRNDTPGGDASVRFTLSDGSKSTTADATVQSDSIYITNTTDTASIDQTDGVSFSEAIAIANADGTGTQTLILASTMAGQTISATSASSLAESLTLDLDSATGATISGGTLTLGGGVTLTMNNGSGDTGSIGTIFAGTGSLSKTGAGTLTLTGTQTYSGTTTISAGALSIASDSNVGSGQLVLNGGTLTVTGSTTINNAINVAADSTFSVSNSVTASGLLSGSNALTKTGASTLTLSNTGNSASFSGAITVSAGTLAVSSDGNLSSGAITLDSGTLNLTGATFTVDNAISLGAGGGTVGAVSGAKVLSGVISGSGSFAKTGGPALTLSATNTFSGGATVSGTNGLSVTDSSNLGSGSVTLNSSSLLTVTGSGVTISNNLVMGGDATLSNANDITWSGVISGSSSLTKSGAGTLTLSGAQTQTGGLNVTAGSVSIAGDSNLGSDTLTLDGGSLIVTGSGVTIDNALSLGASNGTISHANALTWSGVISGSGGLTKTGAGTLTLSATNTNTGSIALSAGTMDVSGAVGGAVSVASGTTLQGEGSISGLVTVNSGGTLQIGSSPGDLTLGNGLTVNSGGTLVTRINGTSAGSSYDQYNVTGTVTLGGTLSVIGSYTGSGGDSFVIINNDASDAVSGIFNGLSEGDKSTTLNGLPLTVSYLGSSGNDTTLSIVAPTVTDAKISISGGSGTSGAYKIGDTVTATWDDTGSGDNNGDITGVTVNFSAFGGGSSVAASNSANSWTATYLITSGSIDGTNLNVSVTATDVDGLSKTTSDTTNATVDNVAPTVTSGNISLSGGSGTSGAYKTGDIVTAIWNNTSGGENNSDTISGVSVDFSAFGGSSVAASNISNTWTATYTILSGAIDATNQNVTVTATDNAGNTKATAGADNVTVDNVAPTLTDAKVSISGATGTSGAYKIGDIVTATWNDTAATGDNNSDTISTVTVNFTAFGGGASVSASNSSDTWTATYTLVAGAIDSSNLNISVTATDNAGNTAFVSDTSNATVDTQAPTVSSVTSSTANGSYKAGDGVSIQILFDQSVFVSGTPQLQLETGATDQNVNYASGSGGSTLNFAYTVQSGDTSTDLDYTGTGALGLNGGSIVDDAGNEATLTLATPGATNSLGANKALVIDTTAPTLSLITPVTTPTNDNTPNITFSTDEAGALSLGGSCGTSSSLNLGSTGNHSITLTQTDNSSALSDGTYSDCTVTVTDAVGNASTALAITAFTVDTTAPSGHSVSFDDGTINASEAASQSFTFASAEVGASYSYSISSSGGGTTVSGNGTIASASQQITSLDLSGLADGTLTLSVILTDTAGNAATAVTNTAALDTTTPSGHSVSFDDGTINATEAASQSFTFASAEVGATFSYSISSSGGGTNVTGSGSLTSATQQVTGVNVSGLSDGTLTLSVVVTDASGNAATAVTANATLDATAPTLAETTAVLTPTSDTTPNVGFSTTEAGTLAVGGSCGSAAEGAVPSGTQTITLTGTDNSSVLADGTYSDCTLTVTDAAGNASAALTLTSFTVDSTAPSGFSVAFNDTLINASEASASTFVFTSGETGSEYNYSVTSSGGGTAVTGSGTLSSASQSITLASLSGLSDGSLTLSVTLTDVSGNVSAAQTAAATLDSTAPTPSLSSTASDPTNAAFTVSISFGESVNGFVVSDIVAGNASLSSFTDNGGGSYSVTATPSADGTVTLDISASVAQDTAGNANTAATQFSIVYDGTAPTPVISSSASNPTNAAFSATIAFGETVSGFAVSDIVAGNASLSGFTDNGSGNYSVTVTPTADGSVTLDIAASAAQDTAGNNSAAATQFSLSYDGSGPTLSSSTPANGAVDVEYNATLSLTFDEDVATGSGSATQISLYRSADDGLVEAIEVSSSQVVISGATVTVDPTDNFTPNQGYYVRIGAEALTDTLGNAYAGLTSGLSFTVGNHVPEATADTATTDEDVAVSIKVLNNDTDEDSQINPASVLVTAAPSHGVAKVSVASGVVVYEPEADYNGADSFSYTVEDVHGGVSAAALVSITVGAVNDAPIAVADVAATNTGAPVSIDVAANDTDIDDAVDATTLTIVATPSQGAAVVNAGKIDYTPVAGFSGSDSFSYTVKDGQGALSNVAIVIVNVNGSNVLPNAADDSATTDEDTAVDIAVLDNDTDSDGVLQASTVTLIANASHGAATVNATTGVIRYEPEENYHGADSFTYIVKDNGGSASNIATVAVTVNSVNDAPVAKNDAARILEVSAHAINVLANDMDVDGVLQPATVEIVAAPLHGVVNINVSTGAVSYTPSSTFSGTDQFQYRVKDDSDALSNTATVTLTTGSLNDAPLANNDSATTNEDTAVVIEVLDNDQDVDGVLDASAISIESAPGKGAVTDNGDGTLTYTPNANVFGSDSFEYSVKDDAGDSSNKATVTIAIAPVNDAPTISGTATASILEGQAYSFTPTLVDVDSGALTVTATNRPSWLSLNATTGALTGTPAVGSAGVYSGIVLSISDGQASASLAAFSITVIGDNDTDGVANDVDTDDDNDGMSDSFELLYGFNPFDSSDAAGDLDGDTISNYQEFVDNTNPNDANDYVDITPPVVVAPEDITIDAIALYTPVTLRKMLGLSSNASDADVEAMLAVLATDNVDGDDCCSVRAQGLLNNTVLLPPGRNLITYRGVDRKGNAATATQVVNIRPLVSVNKDQISVEGATVQFRVILNGQSPFYPLTIPYVIDSLSTASSSDHNLVDGSVTFTKSGNIGQTEASVSIALTADSITENDERLIIRLDDRTTNAEDLAGGYDPTNIYDINAGAKIRHVITIVERNVAPDVTLRLRQNGVDTIQVTPDGGPVTVVATVTDPNPGDTHTYNWSATDNALVDTDGNASNAQLVFSPASLASGRYKAQLTVADASNATDEAKLYFRVVAALPTLDPTVDTDGDGVNDAEEGVADGDDDGIPDYLDNITATNVLPEVASETSSYLVECDPGVRCRLGQFAILGSNGGARLEPEELQTLPDINTDDLFEPQGGVFDFEVHDLATLGQSVRVVLPQDEPLPEGGVYRKFQNNNWTTFVVDANNELHSALGNPGYCPPPGDDSWEVGLISGYYCLQLTIEDGGPNDADGLVNAAVEDPGVVAVDKRTPSDIDSEGGGSGGGAINWTLLLALLGLSILSRRYLQLRASVLAAFLMVSLGAPDVSQAADWEAMKGRLMDRGYLEFGAYHASGSQEAGEFKRGLESEDVTVSINNYDVSRYGYQFLAGYRYHPYMAAEIGFLDLGNVKVSMSASALTSEALKNAVEKHYPVSGSGWTLSNRFLWPVREQITLSAEVGLFLWEGDIQLSGADINPDLKGDTDPILGLGLNYRLHKNIDASIRLKRAFFDGQHVDLMGVGAVWRFKGY
ncbi:tandem-95 repeat protein [Hahella sp. NBU794]|uniref:tandem-95 repeat protein n=1 Tax=Hahella sp. NBU794 TaxID=3422590 RepID=UPI003D6FCED4